MIPSTLVLLLGVTIFWFRRDFEEFTLREATIKSLHKALFDRQTTCHAIVEQYLGQIDKYDDRLRSVLTVNPNANHRALELDALPKHKKVTNLNSKTNSRNNCHYSAFPCLSKIISTRTTCQLLLAQRHWSIVLRAKMPSS